MLAAGVGSEQYKQVQLGVMDISQRVGKIADVCLYVYLHVLVLKFFFHPIPSHWFL